MKRTPSKGFAALFAVLTMTLAVVAGTVNAGSEHTHTRRLALDVDVHKTDFGNRVCREIIRRELVNEGFRVVSPRRADAILKLTGTLVVQENLSDEDMVTAAKTIKITDLDEDGDFDIDDDWVEYGSEDIPIVRGDAAISYDYEITGVNKAKGRVLLRRSGVEESSSGFVDICKDIADEISDDSLDAVDKHLY
ncbi:MAG: hypothetical protein ACPHER_02580 [Nevskiales bacterium]